MNASVNAATETKKTPTIETTVEGSTLTLTFSNGKTLTLDAKTLSEEIREAALMHGLKQKLVDAAAISRNTETGRSASVEDKFEAAREVHERLINNGGWNKTREGGGGNEGGMLLRAMVELYPRKTREQLVSYLAERTTAEKNALRALPKVAKLIASYRPKLDTKALLAGLDDLE